jgi:hypothetical protein
MTSECFGGGAGGGGFCAGDDSGLLPGSPLRGAWTKSQLKSAVNTIFAIKFSTSIVIKFDIYMRIRE